MERTTKQRLGETARFLAINLAGCYVFAMGVQMFTTPFQIAPGGTTGLATIANYLWGVPIGTTAFVLNIPLLILAWRYLSRNFAIRNLVSIVIFSLCTDLLVTWMPVYSSTSALAPLMAALFGGILMGIGNALVYLGRSTTGGTAIIGALLQKRFPQFSLGRLLSVANLIVVVASIFAFGNIDSAIFAAICIYISGMVMDKIVYGMNTNRLIFIISDKSREIEAMILEKLHRGCTVLQGEGGYRHSQTKVIFCVVSKAQFYRVRRMALSVDEHAFLVGCEAGDVLGKGFKHVD